MTFHEKLIGLIIFLILIEFSLILNHDFSSHEREKDNLNINFPSDNVHLTVVSKQNTWAERFLGEYSSSENDSKVEQNQGMYDLRETRINFESFLRKFEDIMSSRGGSDFPYIIHDGNLFCRPEHFNFARGKDDGSNSSKYKYIRRVQEFENMISWALQIGKKLKHLDPRLDDIVGEGSKVPLLFNGGDFCHCKNRTYPLFTFGGAPYIEDCNPFIIPWPTVWKKSANKLIPSYWDFIMQQQNEKYSWKSKIQKAVWRGATTGHADRWRDLPRARLVQHSRDHPHLVDAGFTKIVQKPAESETEILSESIVTPNMDEEDFMKYRAVLDIDGNSMSSRFGRLLCMNSVVIKVEPSCVDSTYMDVKAWVHYLPVKSDLSDLVDVVKYAVDDENELKIQGMIQTANKWCRISRTRAQMSLDILSTLASYVEQLRSSDTQWHEKWLNNIVASASGLTMAMVGQSLPIREEDSILRYAQGNYRIS